MDRHELSRGLIVGINIEDDRGHRKVRPVVVISRNEDIAAGRAVVVAAISTTYPDPPTADDIELPWDRDGRSRTGLRRRSAACANWIRVIEPGDIAYRRGHAPAAKVQAILERIDQIFPPEI